MFYPYREDIEDDLSELTSEAVPDEVRKWLASTFAKQEQVECQCDIIYIINIHILESLRSIRKKTGARP